jgi:hypothetical protein
MLQIDSKRTLPQRVLSQLAVDTSGHHQDHLSITGASAQPTLCIITLACRSPTAGCLSSGRSANCQTYTPQAVSPCVSCSNCQAQEDSARTTTPKASPTM